jgi:hypothetical protein
MADCNNAVRDHSFNRSRKARDSRGTRAVEEQPRPDPPSWPPAGGAGQGRRFMAG